eukprot:m.57160 g.57160  ORF g.57160 m.57160 type:complete len:431 (+) comp13707_c0_seq1:173-1465(+)
MWTFQLLAMLAMAVAVDAESSDQDSTMTSFMENIGSYLMIIVPAAFLVRHLQQHPEKLAGTGAVLSAARVCILGSESTDMTDDAHKSSPKSAGAKADLEAGTGGDAPPPTMMQQGLKLAFCVAGLQGSYITWGVLQEMIMTQSYGVDEFGEDVFFKNSQYLVFINRVLALLAAVLVCTFTRQPRHSAPTYRYSFASMSNIMSSWCQYEALKYVSFPTQVLAKSSKIIPVMIMGKFVQNKTYPAYEYACAVVLSMGVSVFLFSKAEQEGKIPDEEEDQQTNLSGLVLLIGYMIFDSFTSNFQAHLFGTYKMSSYQMMFGVNLFSTFFTLWSLVQRGAFGACIEFTLLYPKFMWQAVLLSITSATGQMFIFYTLSTYGALVFAIIMTTRQVISIFVSAVLFGHEFAAQGWFGILIVFGAMFARIYLRTTQKK